MGPWRIAPPDNASLLHLFRPQHAVWTLRSTPLLRLSSRGWRRLALSGGAIRHGRTSCIWCRNQTVLGAPVGIFGVSTIPNIRDFTNNMAGSHVFSTLDLVKGYYQVEMFPDDIPKTAIIPPFGLFEFVRMPFGLRNAGSTFQRLMDRVLVGLPFIFVYLDDVLIASPDHASHRQHLREVFGRLRENGLTINPKKSVFGQEETGSTSQKPAVEIHEA